MAEFTSASLVIGGDRAGVARRAALTPQPWRPAFMSPKKLPGWAGHLRDPRMRAEKELFVIRLRTSSGIEGPPPASAGPWQATFDWPGRLFSGTRTGDRAVLEVAYTTNVEGSSGGPEDRQEPRGGSRDAAQNAALTERQGRVTRKLRADRDRRAGPTTSGEDFFFFQGDRRHVIS